MAHLIGIVGKPSSGKTTFLNAATLAGAETAPYPFTTIKPNEAVAYVTSPCPCKELGVTCSPQNSRCHEGTRLIPVKLLDVAGLVPGAHEGKGMGNQFMDDLRQAAVLIQVVDISGKTNEKGEPAENYDPSLEIEFLPHEVDRWLFKVLKNNWHKLVRHVRQEKAALVRSLAEGLAGLGIAEKNIKDAAESAGLKLEDGDKWTDDQLFSFASEIRRLSKPIIIAANKIDVPGSEKHLENAKKKFPKRIIVPASAEIELALRNAAKAGLIDYTPGATSFTIPDESKLTEEQKKAIGLMKSVLDKYGSTGVQQCLNAAVFDLLKFIVVYPVENENRYEDKKGNILPDALLVPEGTTAKELAYRIHTDIGKSFIHAVDCRKKVRIGADQVLKNGDIIKIASAAK